MANKVTYRVIPYGAHEMHALEGWLEEKAHEGLIFEEISFGLAKFRRGEPMQLRFLVVPVPKRKLRIMADGRPFYQEKGWSYVTYYTLGVDIYKAEEKETKAIDADKEQEAQWIKRGWRRELWFLLVFFLLGAGISGYDLFHYAQIL